MTASTSKNTEQLDAILQKANGTIENLTPEEKRTMLRLLANAVANDHREFYALHYPGKSIIVAMLMEESHQRRLTRKQLWETLEITREHLSKLLMNKSKPGLRCIQNMRTKLNIDANFILDNI